MTDENIGNVRHDALRAQCVEMADKLDGDGTTLSDLLREAAEALAEQPAGAVGDAWAEGYAAGVLFSPKFGGQFFNFELEPAPQPDGD